jgi:DNA invertase Pin-like site-specific DNA recombinase
MLTVIGAVGQAEREVMLERQCEGIARAQRDGHYKGRVPTARRQAKHVDRRHEPQVIPEQRTHACVAVEIGTRRRVRRLYKILLVSSIDGLGRSVLHVANALVEPDGVGIRLYCDQQGIDFSTPMGRAMIQMASVLASKKDQCSAAGCSRRLGSCVPAESWAARR